MSPLTAPGADARLPLYQRLRDDILARIMAREWLPGSTIPTEAELTARYGVSVGTVRKAVETLVADGLLERNQGRGTFVRRPSFDASLFRFFRHQSNDGAQTIPEGCILDREETVPPPTVAAALGLRKGGRAIRLHRHRRLGGKTVLVEEIWLPRERFRALLALPLAEFGHLLYPLYESVCGETVAAAQETLTVEAADGEVAAALAIPPGDPVVVIDRLALGYDQKPLEWRRSKGAAASFRYQVDIR